MPRGKFPEALCQRILPVPVKKTFLRIRRLVGNSALKAQNLGLDCSFCLWVAWPRLRRKVFFSDTGSRDNLSREMLISSICSMYVLVICLLGVCIQIDDTVHASLRASRRRNDESYLLNLASEGQKCMLCCYWKPKICG